MKALRDLPSASLPPGGLATRALELRELRYFHSVGRTGNFGRAARELNISQPAVSSQVTKLEEGLGTPLLIRHGRGVTLTPAGSCLMDRIDAIMALLNAPLEQAAAPRQTAGAISVALPAEAVPLLVPHILAAFQDQWPNVTLAFREGNSAALEEWVLDRRADIAVLQDPPALNGLDIEPVLTERLGFVSGVRSPGPMDNWNGRDPIGVRQLQDLKLILPHPGHWIRRLVENAAFHRGVVLDRVWQTDGVPLTKEMVRNGLGFTVLPYAAVQAEVARGALLYRPIDRDPLCTVHAIASRGGSPFIAGARRLLRDVMSRLAASGVWAGVAPIPAGTAGSASSATMETAIA